jgi:hypothetical protein
VDSEAALTEVLPEYYRRYLLPAKSALLGRPRIDPGRWWELSEHRAWLVDPAQRLVSTYFGGAGSFAWDESGKFAVVQGYAWIRKGRASITRDLGLAYLALLNSQLFESLLAGVSNHVSGGQWNLSKKFVQEVPIPDLFRPDVSTSLLTEMALHGSRMLAGLPIDDSQLEKLVAELYNVERTV